MGQDLHTWSWTVLWQIELLVKTSSSLGINLIIGSNLIISKNIKYMTRIGFYCNMESTFEGFNIDQFD